MIFTNIEYHQSKKREHLDLDGASVPNRGLSGMLACLSYVLIDVLVRLQFFFVFTLRICDLDATT